LEGLHQTTKAATTLAVSPLLFLLSCFRKHTQVPKSRSVFLPVLSLFLVFSPACFVLIGFLIHPPFVFNGALRLMKSSL
jgi:uncharacterized membrane protein